jgi:hypothetical protein
MALVYGNKNKRREEGEVNRSREAFRREFYFLKQIPSQKQSNVSWRHSASFIIANN